MSEVVARLRLRHGGGAYTTVRTRMEQLALDPPAASQRPGGQSQPRRVDAWRRTFSEERAPRCGGGGRQLAPRVRAPWHTGGVDRSGRSSAGSSSTVGGRPSTGGDRWNSVEPGVMRSIGSEMRSPQPIYRRSSLDPAAGRTSSVPSGSNLGRRSTACFGRYSLASRCRRRLRTSAPRMHGRPRRVRVGRSKRCSAEGVDVTTHTLKLRLIEEGVLRAPVQPLPADRVARRADPAPAGSHRRGPHQQPPREPAAALSQLPRAHRHLLRPQHRSPLGCSPATRPGSPTAEAEALKRLP